jgi:hypothetical protein
MLRRPQKSGKGKWKGRPICKLIVSCSSGARQTGRREAEGGLQEQRRSAGRLQRPTRHLDTCMVRAGNVGSLLCSKAAAEAAPYLEAAASSLTSSDPLTGWRPPDNVRIDQCDGCFESSTSGGGLPLRTSGVRSGWDGMRDEDALLS